MAFTVDYATSVGKVRALTGDVDANIPFLTDEEIGVYLDIEGGHLKLAAAQALLVMASKHAIILKKIEALDLKRDGPAVADSLRRLAVQYRADVANESYIEFADVIQPPLDWMATLGVLEDEARGWL